MHRARAAARWLPVCFAAVSVLIAQPRRHPERIVEYAPGAALTRPSNQDAEAVARRYLLGRVGKPGVSFELESRSSSFGGRVEHLTFTPRIAGIRHFGAGVQVHVDGLGRVIRFDAPELPAAPRDLAFPTNALRAAEVGASSAGVQKPGRWRVRLAAAGAEARTELTSDGLAGPVIASRTWFPVAGQARAAWEVYVEPGDGPPQLLVIDATTEEILYRRSLIQEAEPDGYVFPAPEVQNPGVGGYELEFLSGRQDARGACPAPIYPSSAAAGGLCWTDGVATVGNNTDTCADLDANDVCDGRALGTDQRFLFPFTNAYDATLSTSADLSAAIVNAFYWTNVAHDWLYELGFDEASGNFQTDNFGRGGYGNDAVRVDVHDGAATNNAWFSTPPESIAPRMQLGLWPGARRDVAFDGDVILHEYVHGLTVRLVGGAWDSGSLFAWQSGAMGEGWSDVMAASFTSDPVIGEYATRNAATGVRTVRYDRSPLTFGQFGRRRVAVLPGTTTLAGLPAVHRDGEIWASTLWDVREAVGQQAFEEIVVAALKLTPRRPSMLDGRDAIVQAAGLYGLTAAQVCQVWQAFAGRGMGASAALNSVGPNEWPDTAISVFEAFDLPASCGGSPPVWGSAVHSESAEAGSGWTADGLWHRTTRRAAAGGRSWWFGQEATGTYDTGGRAAGSLTSPTIDLSGQTGAVLEWKQLFRGEGFLRAIDVSNGLDPYLNLDSGRVWVSTNDGASWRVLTHIAHESPGSGFAQYRVNLSEYAGQTIRLRFEFDTFNGSNNAQEGWYVDDIQVRGGGSAAPVLAIAPASLTFAAVSGQAAGAQPLAVSNSGSGVLSWTAVAQSTGWLSAGPGSGTGGGTVQVSANAALLPPGTYSGSVAVNAGSAGSATVPVSLQVAAASPVAAWSFEETGAGPGAVVADTTGSGRNGVTSGLGTAPAQGVSGNGRSFNGLDDAVTVTGDASLTPERMTVRAWVKLTSFPSSFGVILSQFGGANAQGWYLAVRSTGEVVLMGATPPASMPWLVSAGKLELGRWHHIVATLDRTNGRARIYLDGGLDRTGTFPGVAADSASPLVFGKASWTNSYFLNAVLDEAQIVPALWDADSVTQDFSSIVPPAPDAQTGPLAQWSLGEMTTGSGATLADGTGGGHAITLTGARHRPHSGLAGAGRWFGGWPDVATVANGQDFATDSFSFSTWVRLDRYPASWGLLFGNYDGAWAGWYAGVYRDGKVILCAAGPTSKPWLLSSQALSLGRWHHVAVTFDGPSRRGRIYVDGGLAASATFPSWAVASGVAPTLGRAPWGATGWLAFSLDEARFDARERTGDEIHSEYAALAGELDPAPAADWRFDEAQGASELADSSGRGRTAQLADPAAVAVEGAWRFSGAGGATMSPHADLGGGTFTFDARVRLDSLPSGWGVLYSSYASGSRGWYVAVDSTGRVILCIAGQPGSAPWLVSSGAIAAGQWTAVTVTFDAVSRRGAIYLDGALDRTAVFPVHTAQSDSIATFARASWTASYFLPVTIDRARLWRKEYSAQEVQALAAP